MSSCPNWILRTLYITFLPWNGKTSCVAHMNETHSCFLICYKNRFYFRFEPPQLTHSWRQSGLNHGSAHTFLREFSPYETELWSSQAWVDQTHRQEIFIPSDSVTIIKSQGDTTSRWLLNNPESAASAEIIAHHSPHADAVRMPCWMYLELIS